jgi:hypothetical protein
MGNLFSEKVYLDCDGCQTKIKQGHAIFTDGVYCNKCCSIYRRCHICSVSYTQKKRFCCEICEKLPLLQKKYNGVKSSDVRCRICTINKYDHSRSSLRICDKCISNIDNHIKSYVNKLKINSEENEFVSKFYDEKKKYIFKLTKYWEQILSHKTASYGLKEKMEFCDAFEY